MEIFFVILVDFYEIFSGDNGPLAYCNIESFLLVSLVLAGKAMSSFEPSFCTNLRHEKEQRKGN
jgi:hypothetical protein